MKRKPILQSETYKLPENKIPEEIHLNARLIMERLLNMPPTTQKELKENLAQKRKDQIENHK